MKQKIILVLINVFAPFLVNGAITLTFEQDGVDVRVKASGVITSDFGPKNYSSGGIIVMGVIAGYTPQLSPSTSEGVNFSYGSSGSTGYDYYYLANNYVKPVEATNFIGNTPSSMAGGMTNIPDPNFLKIIASFTGSSVYYGSGGWFSGGLKIAIAKDKTSVNSEAIFWNTSLSSFFSEQFFGKSYTLVKQSDPQINLFTLNIVPEPSAFSLLAVGLGGLAIIRRRRS